MRNEPNLKIEQYRLRLPENLDVMRTNTGAFGVPFNDVRLLVVASDGMGWEHVSVSLPNRCPTWEEMAFIKGLWWKDDECVIQFHPPKSEHINNHRFCLHLWRALEVEIPTPPGILVGIKELGVIA